MAEEPQVENGEPSGPIEKMKTLEELNAEKLKLLQRVEGETVQAETEATEAIQKEAYDVVNAWLTDPEKVRRVEVTEDGGFVEYKPLTYGDFLELQKIEGLPERRVKALFIMLEETNPGITEDAIRATNQNHIQQIMAAIASDDNRFLLPGLSKLYRSLARLRTLEKSGLSATGLEKAPENSENSASEK